MKMQLGQLMKMQLRRTAQVSGQVLLAEEAAREGLWQAARDAVAQEVAPRKVAAPREAAEQEVALWEAAACEVARESGSSACPESGSSARPACPSQSLSAATHPPCSKTDHQGQGRPWGFHGRSFGFAPQVGLPSRCSPVPPPTAEPTGPPARRRCGRPGRLPNTLADLTIARVSAPWVLGGRCTGGGEVQGRARHTAWCSTRLR